jgi:3-methylfumaryl-CoA hydratase
MAEAGRAAGAQGAAISFAYRLVSPLFDDQGLIVGTLDGPDGSITTFARDRYGRQTATGILA